MVGFISRNLLRIIQMILGTVFIILGIAGVFLPVVPGMIFLVLGMGLFIRAVPFLSLFLKLPFISERINKTIGIKTKLLIILSLWIPYLFFSFLALYLRYRFSFSEFLSSSGVFDVLSFAIPFAFLLFFSIYILCIKNLGQVFGGDVNNQKR